MIFFEITDTSNRFNSFLSSRNRSTSFLINLKSIFANFSMSITFLQKIKINPFFMLTMKYFVWIVFILEIFLLTNLFSSLDLINAYGIPLLDVFLTFGFLGFLFLVEALVSAVGLAIIQVLLEKFLSTNLSAIATGIILTILIIEWINLFLTEFNAAFI